MNTKYSTTPKVYEAIVKVQEGLSKDGISKNRKNQSQGYAFRGIDDIYNALANLLAAARLCILPRIISREVVERATKNGGALFYVVVDVEFDFVSAEDGSKHTVRMAGEAMDSGDKATNKAMSAAYKYACLQTFCIPTEADNDADAHTHVVMAKPTPGVMTESVMRDLVNRCDWPKIGNHKIATKCSLKGMTVRDAIIKEEEKIRQNFDVFEPVDQMALDAYAILLAEEAQREN